jgi:hypothetical protein
MSMGNRSRIKITITITGCSFDLFSVLSAIGVE